MARGNVRVRSKVRKDSHTVQVYLGVDPKTGKKKYHSEAVKGTKRLADRRLREVLQEVDNGTYVQPTHLTVDEYLEQWMQDCSEPRVTRRTLQGYRGNIRRYIVPAIGLVQLQTLKAMQVQEMESKLLRHGRKNGAPLSPTTVLQVHRILCKALKDAKRLTLVRQNVMEMVEPPRITKTPKRTLTLSEVQNFLDEVDDPQFSTLFLLSVQTGLRRSEILGLEWRDVDLSSATLSVQRAWIQLPSGERVIEVPKSGKGRVVTLPAQSVDALTTHLENHLRLAKHGKFVFCLADGSRLNPNHVTRKFKQVATALGFGDLRLHDLRHIHATLMLSQGVNLKVTSERLGHSTIAITADLYSHVLPTIQEEAARSLGDAWSGIET
jgi:integrase